MAFGYDFFQEQLAALVAEWVSHRNLTGPEALVVLTLVDGRQLVLTGTRAAPDWLMALTEDDEMWFLGYERIANVEVRRRPGQPPEKVVGFRIEQPIATSG